MPADKLLHLLAGAVLYGLALPYGLPAAACIVVGAALCKEAFDAGQNAYARMMGRPEPHTVDLLDALATVAGGAAFQAADHLVGQAVAALFGR